MTQLFLDLATPPARRLRLASAFGALALAAALPQFAAAATFSDTLTGVTLNPNLVLFNDPGYSLHLPGSGAVLSRTAGLPNGQVNLNSALQFSGLFTLAVDVTGLRSGLTDKAEAGLEVYSASPHGFSDVFGYNNTPFFLNNQLGVALNDVGTGPDSDHLTISGDTAGAQFNFGIFLIQEYGGVAANSVRFTNLNLNAERISGVVESGVPEPASWALVLTGFAGLGAALRARRPKVQANPA